MAVRINITITQNSQSIANNTSNVTVKCIAKWTNGSFNLDNKSGWCKIGGTKYTFSNSFNDSKTKSGSKTLYSKKLNIEHNANGTKTLSCSASYTSGISSGTVTDSASKTLTTIPRESTVTVSSGTLGTAQELIVSRKYSGFTHTITYTCGSASGTICTKSTDTTPNFTPPISLASQNTSGSSVSIKYSITTYNGSTKIGSTKTSSSISYAIPSSVQPTASLTVSDTTGYATTYGKYIQGLSKLNIVSSGSGAYGSTISGYKITADGKTYSSATTNTDVISGSGTLPINLTVTDSRGRTGAANQNIDVYPYEKPQITSMTVTRCNSDGTYNSSGEYLVTKFIGNITSLDGQNSATYTIKYKKATETTYCDPITLSTDDITDGYVFSADTNASYNVVLIASDNFNDFTKMANGASVRKLWSFFKNKFGLALGKVAEHENVFEVAYQTKLTGGEMIDILEGGIDIDTLLTTNKYRLSSSREYTNIPKAGTGAILEVIGTETTEGYTVMQRWTEIVKTNPEMYTRYYYSSAWGDWQIPNKAMIEEEYSNKLTNIFGVGYHLTTTATKGSNYTQSGTPAAVLIGTTLRCYMYYTRSANTSAGDITNEKVCTFTIQHEGKISNFYTVGFKDAIGGPVSSFVIQNLEITETTLTFDVYLTAVSHATTVMRSYFTIPVLINPTKF